MSLQVLDFFLFHREKLNLKSVECLLPSLQDLLGKGKLTFSDFQTQKQNMSHEHYSESKIKNYFVL